MARRPSIRTVQAPHCPWSHPFLALVIPSRSRSASSNVVRVSTTRRRSTPSTYSVIPTSTTCPLQKPCPAQLFAFPGSAGFPPGFLVFEDLPLRLAREGARLVVQEVRELLLPQRRLVAGRGHPEYRDLVPSDCVQRQLGALARRDIGGQRGAWGELAGHELVEGEEREGTGAGQTQLQTRELPAPGEPDRKLARRYGLLVADVALGVTHLGLRLRLRRVEGEAEVAVVLDFEGTATGRSLDQRRDETQRRLDLQHHRDRSDLDRDRYRERDAERHRVLVERGTHSDDVPLDIGFALEAPDLRAEQAAGAFVVLQLRALVEGAEGALGRDGHHVLALCRQLEPELAVVLGLELEADVDTLDLAAELEALRLEGRCDDSRAQPGLQPGLLERRPGHLVPVDAPRPAELAAADRLVQARVARLHHGVTALGSHRGDLAYRRPRQNHHLTGLE